MYVIVVDVLDQIVLGRKLGTTIPPMAIGLDEIPRFVLKITRIPLAIPTGCTMPRTDRFLLDPRLPRRRIV